MDLRRLPVNKPIYIYTPITRPLSCVTSTTTTTNTSAAQQFNPQQQPPLPLNLNDSDSSYYPNFNNNNNQLLGRLSSILSKPSLDSSKSKQLLPLFYPSDFDRFFLALFPHVNPKTTLNFFYLASQSYNFHFTLRSYFILILLLLLSNHSSPARLLFIRLIDGKLPLSSPNNLTINHIQIATALADLNILFKGVHGVMVVDLLLHLYCTQFKNVSFTCAFDVFFTLADKGMFPSCKTCNFFLNSLVKVNELQKTYQVFETLSRFVSLDVYLCTTMINAFCKGGRIQDAIALFSKMENLGISPNVVTYNNIIHGLCKSGRLNEAFRIKQNMAKQGVQPSLITYSVLINGLTKFGKFEGANSVLKEMSDKGFVPNDVVYNTLIAGYCKMENIDEALRIRDDMLSKGMNPNSVTFNSLMQGFCRIGQMEHAEHLLEEMLSRGLSINLGAFSSVIWWLCLKSRFDSALHFTKEMLLRNLRPNDRLMTTLVGGLCMDGKNSEAIELWFKLFEKGFAANTVTSNALIHGLCEAGKMQEAVSLLKEMLQRGLVFDRVTYNTLILECFKEGKVEEAFRLKEEMFKRGIQPDIYTYNLLIHGISNMGKMEDAVKVWDECKKHCIVSNVYTYAIMIDGYCKVDKIEEGQNLFNELITNKVELNAVVYNTLIRAYCKNENIMAAFKLRDDMKSKGISPTIATYSSLIHGMCNMDLPEDARQLIVEMRGLGLLPNVVCYTALVGGYCRLGQMDKVGSLLQEMSSYNVQPNKITYTVMIDGYCKLGKMKEAAKLLGEMVKNGIVPDATFTIGIESKVRYCDGSSFTGNMAAVNSVTNLHFRGARVWLAVTEDLLAKGMRNAENLFFPDARLVDWHPFCIVIASETSYLWGSAKNLLPSCTSRMRPDLCFFPQYMAQQIQTPLFIINAAYDSWQIRNILAPGIADPHGHWENCKFDIKNCLPSQIKPCKISTIGIKLRLGTVMDHHSLAIWRLSIQLFFLAVLLVDWLQYCTVTDLELSFPLQLNKMHFRCWLLHPCVKFLISGRKNVSGEQHIENFYGQVAKLHGYVKNLPASCTSRMRMRPELVLFVPQYVVQTMQTPIFFINATYNSWQIKNILAPSAADSAKAWKSCKLDLKKCTPGQLKIIQDFRVQFLSALTGAGNSSSRRMFIDSCYAHCQAGKQITWSSNNSPAVGNTISDFRFPLLGLGAMDWAFVEKSWDKWASSNIGSSGEPLKAALLINYDPLRPSRLLSTIAEQEGIKISPIELSQFVSFIKRNKLQTESFVIGHNQYMVTSIHENWFCARCLNTSKPAGECAIVMQTSAFLLVALYDGSIGSASCAMVSVDQLVWLLNQRNV
ncbi:hypothetical protein CRYUN_Cryun07bG0198500 [Craigia yunnanensis]